MTSERFTGALRTVFLASRWIMAPLCLGLIAALAILLVQFGRELGHLVVGLPSLRGAEVILATLKLVDLVLVANLLLLIVNCGIEIFLPGRPTGEEERPAGAGILEFAALKPKLFASISAIAAIDLLESFVNIESVDKTAVVWEVAMLLAFVVAGVLLAWMDRLQPDNH